MFRVMAKILAMVGFTFIFCVPRISLAHTDDRGQLEVIYDALNRIGIELLENQTKLENINKELSKIPSTNAYEILGIIGIIGAFREMVVMVHYESFLTGTTETIRKSLLLEFCKLRILDLEYSEVRKKQFLARIKYIASPIENDVVLEKMNRAKEIVLASFDLLDKSTNLHRRIIEVLESNESKQ
jgi:hypothetical protein